MPELIYIKGDITNPIQESCVIAHIVNDIGLMGSGVAKAIYTKWPEVREAYLDYYNMKSKYFVLGNIQHVHPFKSSIIIVNMIAQHSIISKGEAKPIRYDALRECLKKTYDYCIEEKMTLHLPKIGTGLARGDWNIISEIIKDEMKVDTYIYEY